MVKFFIGQRFTRDGQLYIVTNITARTIKARKSFKGGALSYNEYTFPKSTFQ